jgi:L-asparagine transporter-like permease
MFKRLANLLILIALAAVVWLLIGTVSGEQLHPYRLLLVLAIIFFYVILRKKANNSGENNEIPPSVRRQKRGHKSWIDRVDRD